MQCVSAVKDARYLTAEQLDKLLFALMPPLAISHHLVRRSTPMTYAWYRSLVDKLLFSDAQNSKCLPLWGR